MQSVPFRGRETKRSEPMTTRRSLAAAIPCAALAAALLALGVIPGFLGGRLLGEPDPAGTDRERWPGYAQVLQLERAFTSAVARATPSVVAVHAYHGAAQGPGGIGSGVILDGVGHVLTCAHVVEGSTNLKVTTSDGVLHEARLVGLDRTRDVALLALPRESSPPGEHPPIARRDLRREPPALGEWVLALGHPGGPNIDRVPAAACGRITGLGVQLPAYLGTRVDGGLYQTDIPIISGNSGGPLLDSQGRLLGLNNAISLLDQRAFAVPFLRLQAGVAQWIRGGGQGYLGVKLRELYRQERIIRQEQGGVLVTSVEPGGPAAMAGLQIGDLLLAVGGVPTPRLQVAIDTIGRSNPGTSVSLEVHRAGQTFSLSAQLKRRMP